jgi:RNA polymerase sigma factor (sigma-70 family)
VKVAASLMALDSDQRDQRDRQISEVVEREQSRLRNFIRRRVPDPRDAEDILQDVFYKLVEANRLLMPIDHVTGWLFRVARNRIADFFRRKQPESSEVATNRDEDVLDVTDLLPSPDAGPEALYARTVLLDELEIAIDELPEGGTIVRLLWNWLLPPLFGWPEVTFWQALGLLALCRILFGGFGGHRSHRSGIRGRLGFGPPTGGGPSPADAGNKP